jgi:membrane protease YdiL (CAAX protease family)
MTSYPASRTTVTDEHKQSHTRLGNFVRRHPLLTLMLVFNTFGQALVFVPTVVKRTDGRELNLEVFQSISLILFLLLPALVITWFVHGPDALRELLRRATRFKVPFAWYLVPLLLVPAGGVLFALSFREGHSAGDLLPAYAAGFLPSLVVQFLSTNWWEELVWMGFVQLPLQRRYGAVKAVLLTTPLFALQHSVLYADLPLTQGLAQLGLLTVVIIFVRSFFAWQYNHTQSLALTGLIHAAANAAAAGFDNVLAEPVQGTLILAILGLVLLPATRGRLGLPKRAVRDLPAGHS